MGGSPINQERRDRIIFYFDEDGRKFSWIAKKEGISEKVTRSLYYSEKNKRRIAAELAKEQQI
jgi:hypothetical protein